MRFLWLGKREVFKKSKDAEVKYGLRRVESLHTLQNFADSLCDRYSVPNVNVTVNEELKARGKNGWFRPPNTLEIAEHRMPKATIIHEFSHYLDYLRRRKAGTHDRKFKQLHLQVLRNYLREKHP